MGRVACAVVLLFGSGCAQLFGVDQTTAGMPDAPAPGIVSLRVQRFELGASIVQSPEDVSNLTATYLIPDDTDPSGLRKVPAVVGASTDTWTAAIPDGTPAVEFTLGDDLPVPFRRQYAFPQRNIMSLYGIVEHPDPQPPAATAILNVQVMLPSAYAAAESFQIYAVGPWYYHPLTAAELPPVTTGTVIGPVNLPYTNTPTTFTTLANRPLAAITMDDRVLALRYDGYDLTGAAEFPQFTQGSATDTLVATMATNPHAPLDVHIDPPTVASRLAATNPAGTALAMAWQVNAAPGYAVANLSGPLLMYAPVAATDSGAITTPFGNPFTAHDWRSTFQWSANKSRTYAVPSLSNMTMTMYAGINDVAEVAPGLVLDDRSPLPVLVSVNEMPLTSDGKVISLDPTKSVALSLVADGPGSLFYQFNVYELVPTVPAGTTLTPQTLYAALSTTPNVTLPNDVFAPGHVYMIRANCITGGYPSFAQGNLWDRTLPYSVGFFDAGVFTVTNP